MQIISLPGFGPHISALGFGGASLGSRVAPRDGMRLVSEAMDLGITWFDLAPAYGAGQAEVIFAQALAEHQGGRDTVQICTKVGLVPSSQPLWKRAVMPVARPLLGAVPRLRNRLRKTGMTANQPVTLTPNLLHSSLERSLTRLRTDYVDVYALHNATEAALNNDAILTTLDDILTSGKARAIAVASNRQAAAQAISLGSDGPFGIVQCSQTEADQEIVKGAAHAGMGLVTHSVFGVEGALAQAETALAARPELRRDMDAAGTDLPALLLARARLHNSGGVVLCSMMSSARLKTNAAHFKTPVPHEIQKLVETLIPSL